MPETFCVKRISVYIKNLLIKQLCNHELRDFVRKPFATFEKWAPALNEIPGEITCVCLGVDIPLSLTHQNLQETVLGHILKKNKIYK